MRRLVSCLIVFLLLSGVAFAQAKATAQNVPEIPFDSVPNFLKLPPNLYLGEAIGVATNSKGHIFVYTRSANTRLFEFDQNGTYVREIGEGNYGFEFAHSVRVDPQDNIWVSDGYTNHRVVKYDKNGRFLRQVGSERPGSEPSQFNTPHGIAVDAQGNVYVADRTNNRMQVFDNNLVLRAIYDNIGTSWTVCISPGPHQYLFTSNSNPNGNGPGTWENTGEIYKMELDGRILGRFGHASKEFGGFQVVHMMDCRNPDQIFVAEIESWRVQKLMLKPQAAKVAAAK